MSFEDKSNGYVVVGTGTLGTGTPGIAWQNSQSPLSDSAIHAVAEADFNADGIPDLALVNDNSYGSVTILLGKGDGTFTTVAAAPQVGEYPTGITVGDFNSDGLPDLAVVNNSNPSTKASPSLRLKACTAAPTGRRAMAS